MRTNYKAQIAKLESQKLRLEMERDTLSKTLAGCQFTLIHLAVIIKDEADWLEAHADAPPVAVESRARAEQLRKEIPK